jgi:hypothetical protein
MMRVVAASRSLHLESRRADGAVDIDRQAFEVKRPNGVRHDLSRQADECVPHRGGAACEPATDSSCGRQHREFGEAQYDRIAGQIL